MDVKHILITHLDPDHTGGLSDFPDARVHILYSELKSAMEPANYRERVRYRRCRLAHGPRWITHHKVSTKPWFELDCIRDINPSLSDFVLIPLDGHTRGHCGVAIRTGSGWLLHAGDACHHEGELLHLLHLVSNLDRTSAARTILCLCQTIERHADEITVCCSHDPEEYERFSGRELK